MYKHEAFGRDAGYWADLSEWFDLFKLNVEITQATVFVEGGIFGAACFVFLKDVVLAQEGEQFIWADVERPSCVLHAGVFKRLVVG